MALFVALRALDALLCKGSGVGKRPLYETITFYSVVDFAVCGHNGGPLNSKGLAADTIKNGTEALRHTEQRANLHLSLELHISFAFRWKAEHLHY